MPLTRIAVTSNRVYSLLLKRIGKKHAKLLAFSKRPRGTSTKKRILTDAIGYSLKLKDIRLLKLFSCSLSPRQAVILENNGQEYWWPRI